VTQNISKIAVLFKVYTSALIDRILVCVGKNGWRQSSNEITQLDTLRWVLLSV